MALPVRDQVKYWGIAAAAALVVLWVLGDVILPFVLGAAAAYFLDPVADRLERMGLGRAAGNFSRLRSVLPRRCSTSLCCWWWRRWWRFTCSMTGIA
jgi:predicted PurR-regulated permease PerM